MNFGIITSFVIGGLFLLTIFAYNRNLSSTAQEVTLTTINQQKMDNLAKVLTYDFDRLGFNGDDDVIILNPLQASDDDQVEFSVSSIGSVHWYADESDAVSSTSNPNDYYLYREDENGDTYKYLVTNFEIKYFVKNFSGNWDEVLDPSSEGELGTIRVEVEILMESAEPIRSVYSSGTDIYHRTAWKRVFVPTNVNLKQWD